MFFKIGEAYLALLDFFADAAIEAGITRFDKLVEPAVGDDVMSDLQAACEGVHPADVGVEEVDWLEGFAAHFSIKIESSGLEAAHFKHAQHDLRGHVNVGGELVGVPAYQFIAGIGINRTQRPGSGSNSQFVLHCVTGEGGVIGFNIQLEVVQQIILAQEVQAGSGVAVILVGGGLTWLRLNVELSFEANLFFVVHGHVQQAGEVIQFPLHVGIQQSGIPLAASPERVAETSELMGYVHGFFHLSRCIRKNIRIGTGARTLVVARMGKEAGSAPKQLDTGLFLKLAEVVRDHLQSVVALLQRAQFRRDIAVVEAVVINAQLARKFETSVCDTASVLHRVAAVIPRADGRACPERIGQGVLHRMPVGDAKPQVVLHLLFAHELVGIVMAESQRVLGLGTFKRDFFDIGEKFLTHEGATLEKLPGGGKPLIHRNSAMPLQNRAVHFWARCQTLLEQQACGGAGKGAEYRTAAQMSRAIEDASASVFVNCHKCSSVVPARLPKG